MMSNAEQLMTERYPDMRGAELPILERINEAARRVSGGQGLMRIPVESTDVDIVLADCGAVIKNLASERDELVRTLREVTITASAYFSVACPREFHPVIRDAAELLAKYLEAES